MNIWEYMRKIDSFCVWGGECVFVWCGRGGGGGGKVGDRRAGGVGLFESK